MTTHALFKTAFTDSHTPDTTRRKPAQVFHRRYIKAISPAMAPAIAIIQPIIGMLFMAILTALQATLADVANAANDPEAMVANVALAVPPVISDST